MVPSVSRHGAIFRRPKHDAIKPPAALSLLQANFRNSCPTVADSRLFILGTLNMPNRARRTRRWKGGAGRERERGERMRKREREKERERERPGTVPSCLPSQHAPGTKAACMASNTAGARRLARPQAASNQAPAERSSASAGADQGQMACGTQAAAASVRRCRRGRAAAGAGGGTARTGAGRPCGRASWGFASRISASGGAWHPHWNPPALLTLSVRRSGLGRGGQSGREVRTQGGGGRASEQLGTRPFSSLCPSEWTRAEGVQRRAGGRSGRKRAGRGGGLMKMELRSYSATRRRNC